MISIYAVFAGLATVACSLLAVIVYLLNRKGSLNRIFIFTIAFGAYSALSTYMVIQADSVETAYLWNKIGFMWPFFLALLLQFVMVFTETHLIKQKIRYIMLYGPAFLISILDLTTNEISGIPINGEWGYMFRNTNSIAGFTISLWSSILSIGAILLCLRYFLKTSEKNKKQQAKVITIGLAIPIIINLLTKAGMILFGWYIPYYGVGGNAILCVFIVYAILKYDLFNLNPSIAAENIIATMPDSFILTDSKGIILRANPALTNLLGYREKELVGKNVNSLLDEKQTPLLDEITQIEENKNLETQMITKDFAKTPVAISSSLIRNKKGEKIGITLIIHDLTRLKQYEEKILKNERLAAIGELAGMVSHDLRNPLSSMQAATYYLKKHNTKTDKISREMLDAIQVSIEYSNRIINDLLDYSREIKLKIEETTPKSLINSTLTLTPPPENVKVIDLTQDEQKIQVDKVHISRVFANIIKNAFDAMPNGGNLTIRNKRKEDTIEISFEDTGSGMTKEVIDKLWTPLFTTKIKGMGFGLSICKRIVEAHGGNIDVKSVLQKGTTFTIAIPVKN